MRSRKRDPLLGSGRCPVYSEMQARINCGARLAPLFLILVLHSGYTRSFIFTLIPSYERRKTNLKGNSADAHAMTAY